MTYEEAIEYITERYVTMSMCLTLDECRKHNKAISMAIDALEKQIPKKIVKGKDLFWEYQCPNTNCDTQFTRHASYKFCPGCGQAIDWSAYK